MLRFLFLLILAIPVMELWLLIEVGGTIGGFSCVLLVVATAVIGGILARKQGFDVVQQMRQRMAAGEPIVAETLDALILFFAGTLLLFPGLMSDGLGFLLLIAALRNFIKVRIMASYQRNKSDKAFYRYDRPEGEKVIDIDATKS